MQLPKEIDRPSEAFLAVLHQQWMQQDATRALISALKEQIESRRQASIQARLDPARCATHVTREYHLKNILEFVQSGEFLKPTNQRNQKLDL